jgi:hypothetical protein
MKVRQGFVSNSSSTSFVVVLNKEPKTRKDLHEIMFGSDKEQLIVHPWDWYEEGDKEVRMTISSYAVVDYIFRDSLNTSEKERTRSVESDLYWTFYYFVYDSLLEQYKFDENNCMCGGKVTKTCIAQTLTTKITRGVLKKLRKHNKFVFSGCYDDCGKDIETLLYTGKPFTYSDELYYIKNNG